MVYHYQKVQEVVMELVQILDGKVDSIDRDDGVIHVILNQREADGDTSPFVEHLRLDVFEQAGIQYECQLFTYAVYKNPTRAVITPVERTEED
jgi:hypothetical protein